jgi:hypothetical protein
LVEKHTTSPKTYDAVVAVGLGPHRFHGFVFWVMVVTKYDNVNVL